MTLPDISLGEHGPISRPAGGSVLAGLLVELENRLVELGMQVRPTLREGSSRDSIVAKLSSAGLIANDEVVAWFEWQNGTLGERGSQTAATLVIPRRILSSLDTAIAQYRNFVDEFVVPSEPGGVTADPRDFSMGVGHGWLPLTSGLEGGLHVYCRGKAGDVPLIRMAEFAYADDHLAGKLQAVSLCTIVSWWIQGIDAGAYTWNGPGKGWAQPTIELIPPLQWEMEMV